MAIAQVSRTTPSTDGPIMWLGETQFILPVQFFPESATSRTGEQRLMAAVLEDAIALHFKPIPPSTSKLRRKLQQEQAKADHWLRSNDRASAFSFLRICEALTLEPQYLRRGLRRFRSTPSPTAGRRNARTWMHIHSRDRGVARGRAG